jgi:20S proteasome subunit beta 7
MSEADAEKLLCDALRVCYYRDKQSINKFQIGKATGAAATIGEPFALETKWDYRAFAAPTKWAIGAW